MKTIKNYVEKIIEETDDAKEYAEKFLEEKSKGEMPKSNKYCEMANDELKHANYIHDFAVSDISNLEKVYTIPTDMLDKWEHAHKEYVENVAWIKQMLSM